jgi:putative membrane protein
MTCWPVADHRREPLVYAVVIYALLAADSVSGFITAPHGTVTDQAGVTWSIHAIYESMFVINLFGTFVMAALAATKLARNDLALHGS